jgi:U3 small nucleolar RNA-associated protein 21
MVWHLGERKLQTVIHGAHACAVTHLHFFAGEPVLMSSGADNSVKHFIFDNADGSARELRGRAGHAAPPKCLAFYGDSGTVLLSAAEDRAVRVFSVVQDQQSRELSQVRLVSCVCG